MRTVLFGASPRVGSVQRVRKLYSTWRTVSHSRRRRTVAMAGTAALVWYRRDLRVADHEPLTAASKTSTTIAPFYAFDATKLRIEREETGSWPTCLPEMGPHRSRFFLEALACLQRRLESLGSGLHFSYGTAADRIPLLVSLLAKECGAVELYYHLDYGLDAQAESVAAERAFLDAAKSAGVSATIHRFWDRTLTHPADLPAAWADSEEAAADAISLEWVGTRLARSPTVMTEFRKGVEAENRIRPPLGVPSVLPSMLAEIKQTSTALPASVEELYAATDSRGALDKLAETAGTAITGNPDDDSMLRVDGGETAAAERLQHLLTGEAHDSAKQADGETRSEAPMATFKDTRMLATGADNSAKISASLSFGCITARQVWAALDDAGNPEATLEGRKALHMHMQIRDFFQFMHLKQRGAHPSEWVATHPPELQDMSPADIFQRWCRGETGFPFVDASMRELAATGYMSNRSRQNVASILAKGFGVDWRWGEAWFRCMLVDYDPAANEGNWQYVAGVDLDPRAGGRVFRTVSQGMKYDESAELIRRWIPQLRSLPAEIAHQPWLQPGIADYPQPMIDPNTQLRHQDQKQKLKA